MLSYGSFFFPELLCFFIRDEGTIARVLQASILSDSCIHFFHVFRRDVAEMLWPVVA